MDIAIPIPKECKSLVELCIVKNGILIVKDMNVPLSETCLMWVKNKKYLVYIAILDVTPVPKIPF